MNMLKKIAGKSLYFIAQLISMILGGLISITEIIVSFVINIAKGFMGFIGIGGCLLIIMFAAPFGLIVLLNPIILVTILFFVIFPILGTKFISYLKYIKYTMTEFLFDRAEHLIDGKKNEFKSFNEYGNKYKKMEEDRKNRERQQRQAEQQKQWEERFRQWGEYQGSQQGNGNYQWQGQNAGYGNGQTYVNPTTEFKSKYEKSCDLLGVGYDIDKYQVKLAYRKKAKEYHPDLNKAPDATKMFQQINDAYEFLSDDNIERYKSMK